MLFRILGFVTSFGNIAVIAATFYNKTITKFGSPHWNIALGSILFLSTISIAFFYINNRKEGVNALKVYGGIYALFSLVIYTYLAIKNLFFSVSLKEYSSLFMIFSTFIVIAFLAIQRYMQDGNERLIMHVASLLSILTVGVTFATIYKYVFIQLPFNFDNLILELFIIFIGSVLFLSAHNYGKR